MLNSVFKFEAGPYFLYIKKHYCFNCGKILERKIERKYLDEESAEAKKIKYEALYTLDSAPPGNFTLCKYIFTCNKCKKVYSIKEIKKLKI